MFNCLLGDGQSIRLAVDAVIGTVSAIITFPPRIGGYLGGGVTVTML